MTRILCLQDIHQLLKFSLIISILLASLGVNGGEAPALNPDQIQWLGEQIYTNECNRNFTCLTSWNEGEDFPSMGIGHFIWYRADQQEIFSESFPDLMRYLQNSGVQIPVWIEEENFEAPWPDRAAFLADLDSNRLQELRTFLLNHSKEQTAFIISRFERSLEEMLASTIETEKAEQIRENYYRVASSNLPYGIYALIDYVNFKGTGISKDETYQDEGWGLKQVLLGMDNNSRPLDSFIDSARSVLASRVANAPAERQESRWLVGWYNRLETYRPVTEPVNPETGN